jgi:hypothetical protein
VLNFPSNLLILYDVVKWPPQVVTTFVLLCYVSDTSSVEVCCIVPVLSVSLKCWISLFKHVFIYTNNRHSQTANFCDG